MYTVVTTQQTMSISHIYYFIKYSELMLLQYESFNKNLFFNNVIL